MLTWLLAVCAMTHLVLVADFCNPTIRKCLVAFKDTLSTYDHQSLHERVLGLFGTREARRGEVEALLASCTDAFDTAKEIITTPFFGASNISEHGRPIAIDGSRVLIDGGHHREAVFWIAVIHTWCQKELQNDAPAEIRDRFDPGYRALLGALGIESDEDLETRMEQTRALLPEVWRVAEDIIARNRDIVD